MKNKRDSLLQVFIASAFRAARNGTAFTLTALGFTFGACLTVLARVHEIKFSGLTIAKNELVALLAAIVTITAAGFSMLNYLKTDSEPVERRGDLADFIWRLRRLERAALGVTSEARNELIASIKTDAANKMAEEFEKRLQERFAAAHQVTGRAKHVRLIADDMLSRLKMEVRALMRRGNLNLVLGTVTTVAAAILLAYIALTTTAIVDTTHDWRYYMPTFFVRLSVVIFIEIFAFFFLRLYRSSLTEIKYFQNEITNLEAKCLALEFAILAGDDVSANKVVDQLARTERNFILKKNETTVELENARLEAQHIKQIFDGVKEIVPNQKAKSASS